MANRHREYFPYGLQLSTESWERFKIGEILEPVDGEGPVPEMVALRQLAQKVNKAAGDEPDRWSQVYAGDLSAAGLLNDIFRYLIDVYCREELPGSMPNALESSRLKSEQGAVDRQIECFVENFPPLEVQLSPLTSEAYLASDPEDPPTSHEVPREKILLDLSRFNRAMKTLWPLMDDRTLKARTQYPKLVREIEEYYQGQPPIPELGETLFGALRAPLLASPDSLDGQLEYVFRNWGRFLPDRLQRRLLLTRDILKEEKKQRGHIFPSSEALSIDQLRSGGGLGAYPEYERFSEDQGWMENVVLMAKSTYVWLDQISKKYRREIRTLDQIPDEELDLLASWGITGLWLIGLWERSCASQWIKQWQGNPDALPSAYSLYDYQIASDLGGEAALNDLRSRAWSRGIRLASDMVPNHVGLYSHWVVNHPDWFVQLPYPPYPNYTFGCESLSPDPRIGLHIEDGYWDHRDAAVVFKRIDHHTGDTRYIYHGNDGTHMPWNDTAQLDYLKAEVREAVIQTILHVARQFPIIRFDAAMTLAKKHYQRLWYPPPGEGGDIPSRAERGLSREEFDRLMPEEFWREVVDRVAREVPDTLLLAEAFWLMEGYFVRTLGMHRVYNSAFMNMLKMEDNAKFRSTIKNVLEFSPQILKRFVNFMNNPDEETAVAQFGKGDKYFGVAMLLVTMPGLPMIGHGQVEGYTEKYGMEYRRAYYDEQVDQGLVRRHEHEIFPLMRKRYLFAGSTNFALFDYYTPEGHVDENVIAYSNRAGDERAVTLYNNAYHSTHGTLHTSSAINIGNQENPNLVRRTLVEALGLSTEGEVYYRAREHRSREDFLLKGSDLGQYGLTAPLHGYQYRVYLGFEEIRDRDGSWWQLYQELGGGGVPDLWGAHRNLVLRPFHDAVLRFVEEGLCAFASALDGKGKHEGPLTFGRYIESLQEIRARGQGLGIPLSERVLAPERVAGPLEKVLSWRRSLPAKEAAAPLSGVEKAGGKDESKGKPEEEKLAEDLELWACLAPLGRVAGDTGMDEGFWFDEWRLFHPIERFLSENWRRDHSEVWETLQMLRAVFLLLEIPEEGKASNFADLDWNLLWEDHGLTEFLAVNEHEGIRWFSKERYEALGCWLAAVWELTAGDSILAGSSESEAWAVWREWGTRSGYQVDRWKELVLESEIPSSRA
jgi:glycosidase